MKKISLFILLFFLVQLSAFSLQVFNYPSKAVDVAKNIPAMRPVTCNFSQKKILSNGNVITSKGIFKITKDRDIVFQTLYPINSISSFSANQNKQISKIIAGIANKNYSYIEQNFNLYYQNENNWIFALKPKASSKLSKQLSSLILSGDKKFINQININTVNAGNTLIIYSKCE